ncbi:MAG TPA: hypothetical protein VEA69_16270 [Tepidisphaeraceae bacterium]|nr:hypothetical protein [Tepidisphaeraceae bacterium]
MKLLLDEAALPGRFFRSTKQPEFLNVPADTPDRFQLVETEEHFQFEGIALLDYVCLKPPPVTNAEGDIALAGFREVMEKERDLLFH